MGRTRVVAIAVGLAVAGLVAVGSVVVADRAPRERVAALNVAAVVADNGDVAFTETFTWDFDTATRRQVLRWIPTTPAAGRPGMVNITDVGAASRTADATVTFEPQPGAELIVIGDPDSTLTGTHDYRVAYTLGAVAGGQAGDATVELDVIGAESAVPINGATASVSVPGPLVGGGDAVVCSVGEPGSTSRCATTTTANGDATVVAVGPVDLGAGEGVSLRIRYAAGRDPDPPDVSPEAPTLAAKPPDRSGLAQVAGPAPPTPGGLLAALVAGPLALVAAAGGAWLATRRFGRDLRWAGGPADAVYAGGGDTVTVSERDAQALVTVAFTPPAGVRPGEGGALWRLRPGDDDKVATVVDLALRGWLTIDDTDRRRPVLVWRGTGDAGELEDYERDVLAGLFPAVFDVTDQPASAEDAVCRLGKYSPSFAAAWTGLGTDLDARLAGRHWLRPGSAVRTAVAAAVGVVAVVAGIGWCVAVASGRWSAGSVLGYAVVVPGLALAGGGLGALAGSAGMRSRTAAGFAVWAQVEGLRRFMAGSEGSHARDAADRGVLRQYTAWAVALDEVNRWERACAAAGVDPTAGWLVGGAGLHGGVGALRAASTRAATSPRSSGGSSGSVGGGAGGGGFGSR